MFQIFHLHSCRVGNIRLFVSVLVLGLGLGMVSDAQAKAPCRNKITQFGDVVAVDVALEQFTLETLGRQATFQTNNTTKFKGKTLDSVADIQVGQRIEANYCPVFQTAGVNGFAYKVAFTTLQFPPGQVVNLNVPPGTESVPVARVYAEDPKDKISGIADKHNVAFGDINGDGFDDMILAVSNRKTTATGTIFPGGVNIIYGGPNNVLGNSIEINTTGAISSLGETQILPTARTSLGRTVATGDFDGDGYDDVFLGGTRGSNSVAVHIVYGSAQLPGSVITLDVRRADPDYTLINTVLGSLLASGDVNADGLADLITTGGLVIYGDTALRGVKIKPNGTDNVVRATADTRISVIGGAGLNLASDDVNGDGYDDIVMGGTQRLYVVYGSATLPGTVVNLGPNLALNGATLVRAGFSRGGFGGLTGELSTGDINNDGFADLLFGTSGNGVRTGVGFVSSLGEVDVVYGGPSLPSSTIDLISNPAGTYGETRIMGVEFFGTGFGTSISSADVNGDGFDDLILGAPGAGHPGITPKQSGGNDGALYVLFGKASLAGRQLIDPRAHADITVLADNPKDLLGWSTAAGGDINRDGIPEYATIASQGENPSSTNPNQNEGYLVAIAGQSTAASASRTQSSIADDAPPADFGPVIRTVLDFDSGLDVSTETVTLTRAAPTTLASSVGAVLPIQWSVSSDRSGYTMDLTLSYTDDELGNADETGLTVYTSADGTSGSWTVAGVAQNRDALRNEITVIGLDSTGIYTLVDPNSTPPVTSSDLRITLAASSDPIGLGNQLVYTMTVINNGPDVATGVTVTDTLAAGVTFVSASPVGCINAGGAVSCDLGVLANGATANVAITVSADAVGTITNSASVAANESDPDSVNNTASVDTTIAGAVLPDLTASITKLKAKFKKGKTQLEFRVSVLNSGIGPSTATAIIEAYASVDAILDVGSDTLIATWVVNPLIAGQSSNFKFKSNVSGDLSGQNLIIRIDATSAVTEEDENNNQLSRQIP